MRRTRSALAFLALTIAPHSALRAQADGWWRHLSVLAHDSLRGRETGSREEAVAARYIADQFRRAGLRPGANGGWFQPVRLVRKRIDESHSRLTIARADGTTEELALGRDAFFALRFSRGGRVEAPLVFVGYGLSVPEKGHADLAGLDLRGKVAVYIIGGPAGIPGPLLSHHQAERWEPLRRAGVVGVIAIANPRFRDLPWERQAAQRLLPAFALADPVLAEPMVPVAISFNSVRGDALLSGSGHTMADLLAIADTGGVLPRFPIPATLRAEVAITSAPVESRNVVGLLRGRDPRLSREYVVVTAHHDHIGVGRPVNGDSVYNGALDDAAGVATVLETVFAMTHGPAPRRSVLFLSVTGEEMGLLGSRAFARAPTVPRDAIVANVNVDFPVGLWAVKAVGAAGESESDLGVDLRRVAAARGLVVLPDPEPQRNAFIRSDQYSFIRQGVPALAIGVGMVKDSPEWELRQRWAAERYHAPSDDLAQPIDRQGAEDFNHLFLDVVRAVADRPTRPRWNEDSFFRRFATSVSAR